MIRLEILDDGDTVPDENGRWVLYTDHLLAMSELEKQNAKLREELDGFKEGMPPAKDLADLLAYYDGAESLWLNHGFGPGDNLERFRSANSWLRRLAGKVGG